MSRSSRQSVTNSGTVRAKLGTVALGGANAFTVDLAGDRIGLLRNSEFAGPVTSPIQADFRRNVFLTARTAEGLATGGRQCKRHNRRAGRTQPGWRDRSRRRRWREHLADERRSERVRPLWWRHEFKSADGTRIRRRWTASALDASATELRKWRQHCRHLRQYLNRRPRLARGGVSSRNGGTIETSSPHSQLPGRAGGCRINAWTRRILAARSRLQSHGRQRRCRRDQNSLNADTSVLLQTTASGTSGPGNPNGQGNGDIYIDSAISWTTDARLRLSMRITPYSSTRPSRSARAAASL